MSMMWESFLVGNAYRDKRRNPDMRGQSERGFHRLWIEAEHGRGGVVVGRRGEKEIAEGDVAL